MIRVRNTKRHQRVINMLGKTQYIAPRSTVELTEAEFKCTEIQNLIKKDYLRVVGGAA